ncbi:MAG: aminotransferase class V-fold PLP-dependent enzyme [Terriglobia bacterium]|jgi:cysteine sulfinate desulfinase/cysteine desulfurase-like protein
MWANNETGVLFPVERIAEICRSRGVLYHCDTVQAAGKLEIDVRNVPVDYLALTGHKFHALKGIGSFGPAPTWRSLTAPILNSSMWLPRATACQFLLVCLRHIIS